MLAPASCMQLQVGSLTLHAPLFCFNGLCTVQLTVARRMRVASNVDHSFPFFLIIINVRSMYDHIKYFLEHQNLHLILVFFSKQKTSYRPLLVFTSNYLVISKV